MHLCHNFMVWNLYQVISIPNFEVLYQFQHCKWYWKLQLLRKKAFQICFTTVYVHDNDRYKYLFDATFALSHL